MKSYSQEQIFLFFLIIGIILGIIFDFFRALRKCIKVSDNITFFQDLLYIILSISLISVGIIKINQGIVRLFLFIGIFCGIFIYSLTISDLCVIIFTIVFKISKYFSKYILRFVFYIKKCLKMSS